MNVNYLKQFSASFTRPADTTAYASGDLVANSTTAGSVVPLKFGLNSGASFPYSNNGLIHRIKARKTSTTTTSASFRLHLFKSAPTVANGDNGAASFTGSANYLGYVDTDMSSASTVFTDGLASFAVPDTDIGFNVSGPLYGLVEARAAYTPASGETFTFTIDVIPGDR